MAMPSGWKPSGSWTVVTGPPASWRAAPASVGRASSASTTAIRDRAKRLRGIDTESPYSCPPADPYPMPPAATLLGRRCSPVLGLDRAEVLAEVPDPALEVDRLVVTQAPRLVPRLGHQAGALSPGLGAVAVDVGHHHGDGVAQVRPSRVGAGAEVVAEHRLHVPADLVRQPAHQHGPAARRAQDGQGEGAVPRREPGGLLERERAAQELDRSLGVLVGELGEHRLAFAPA